MYRKRACAKLIHKLIMSAPSAFDKGLTIGIAIGGVIGAISWNIGVYLASMQRLKAENCRAEKLARKEFESDFESKITYEIERCDKMGEVKLSSGKLIIDWISLAVDFCDCSYRGYHASQFYPVRPHNDKITVSAANNYAEWNNIVHRAVIRGWKVVANYDGSITIKRVTIQ